MLLLQSDIPDGHRAPVPQVHSGTRSIDTQTPCRSGGTSYEGRNSESPASPSLRPYSTSPAIPIIPGLMENSPRPSSTFDSPSGSTSGNKSDKEGKQFTMFYVVKVPTFLYIPGLFQQFYMINKDDACMLQQSTQKLFFM